MFRVSKRACATLALILIFGSLISLRLGYHNGLNKVTQASRKHTTSASGFPPFREGCFTTTNSDIEGPVDLCAAFPKHRLSEIQLIVKTGIAERDRLKILLTTFGSCIPNLLIVSDMIDHVAGFDVVDILADLDATYSRDNPDWAAYAEQQDSIKKGSVVVKSDVGWRLDRFKFLPMVDRAFKIAPEAKWYVFIETDIYYFWDTLFRTLDRLDPEDRHYLGSPATGASGIWFAYGGAGTILSHRLVRDLLQSGHQQLAIKYMDLVKGDPCGDAALGYAIFEELGHRLGHLYPTFSGEDIEGLQIPDDKWCIPLAALHHVTEEQMRALWAWERCRFYTEAPITYSSFLDFAISPLLRDGSEIEFWDNGASELVVDGQDDNTTLATCIAACQTNEKCLQFVFKEGLCYRSDHIQLGKKVVDKVTSGWDVAKLEARGLKPFQKLAHVCEHVKWLDPVVGNPFP